MIPNTNACIKDILCIVIYQDQIYLTHRFCYRQKTKVNEGSRMSKPIWFWATNDFIATFKAYEKVVINIFYETNENWAQILIFVILMLYFHLGIFRFSDSIKASRIWCNNIPNTCMVIVYYYIKSFTATRKKIST